MKIKEKSPIKITGLNPIFKLSNMKIQKNDVTHSPENIENVIKIENKSK